METIKIYTDKKQSYKLKEFLPLESADMWYWEFPTAPSYNDYGYPMFHKGEGISNVPCWSLAALLNTIPAAWKASLERCSNGTFLVHLDDMEEYDCYANNPVDACVTMIEKLHERNLL